MENREAPRPVGEESERQASLSAHEAADPPIFRRMPQMGASVPSVHLKPFTSNCSHIVQGAEHILIGISALNGYYKPRNITQLIRGCVTRFRRVDILIAGYEQAYTLVATGVEPRTAVRRAQRAIKDLRNTAVKALRDSGVRNPAAHVNSWTQLASRPGYHALRARASALYREDASWRMACRDATRAAIQSITDFEPTEAAIDIAVSYPLAEIPFLIDSPSIFGIGSSVFTYHRPMPLIDFVLQGRCAASQGFAVLTAATTDQIQGDASDRI